MRRLLPASLLAALAACGSPVEPGSSFDIQDLPATVTLREGQSIRVSGTVIGFAGVTGDSRCPTDVVCVQEGNAEVRMTVGPQVGLGPVHLVTLNTSREPRSSGEVLGLNLTLVRLLPEPVSTSPTVDYRVEIRIETALAP